MELERNEQQLDDIFKAVINDGEARVNVTWGGQNGDMSAPVAFDSTDADVKGWVTEALRTGSIPGIRADAGADLNDFVVDRFAPTGEVPFARIMIRPKTPFGL